LIAVIPVQDIRVPDLAERIAVWSDSDEMQREQNIIELGNCGNNAEQERVTSENGEPERAPTRTFQTIGLLDISIQKLFPP
jgi:hypothetical protein